MAQFSGIGSAAGLEALRSFWADSLAQEYAEQDKDESDARSRAVFRLLSPEARARPHPPIEVPFAASVRTPGA